MSTHLTQWTKLALLATTFLPGFACAADLFVNPPSLQISLPANASPELKNWFEALEKRASSIYPTEIAPTFSNGIALFYDFNLANNKNDITPLRYFISVLPGLSPKAQTDAVKHLLEIFDGKRLSGRLYNTDSNESRFVGQCIQLLVGYSHDNKLSIDFKARFEEQAGIHRELSNALTQGNRQ